MNHREHDVVRVAISSCGPQLEVALRASSVGEVSLIRLGAGKPRSTLVLAAVDLLFENAGLTADELQEVVISRGPGSFTGIRAGLATAAGLASATGAVCLAYDSLFMHAARCDAPASLWSAQPGRRGEVYARGYELASGEVPIGVDDIEILAVADLAGRGPWVAAEGLDLGQAERAVAVRSAAEALLLLAEAGAEPQPVEPLYIEGPPIHRAGGGN